MPTRRVRPKRRHCSKPKSDARIRPFRLLELPGEIRNRVYGFVLSAPNGLTVRCEADTYQVNQLQYFCWQLRKETAGLEIQYNQVHFVDYPKMRGNAMIGFFVFAGGWFTEDAFKEGIHRELAAATPEDFMYLASGGADAWMDFARRWVSDGV
ncbi:conserved hypothetical protein [Pyrenophora tritici-repentis Pt-1C-BFP]|uniref:Uncharacterized protein n=1 Tax=Pyrenophora tritici-repentis (strain Pt-1C-BFP) TaxID=426418 RepID=B2WN61_PYRTR|nr:uncharacterized protein PTRG_11510 [Pyrenophora tritici-repentis Pt-1C-BFP]EDU44560.1 conserved hypothetical protein [Pyrenophora tritici-repentis Pt-1C-BFP]